MTTPVQDSDDEGKLLKLQSVFGLDEDGSDSDLDFGSDSSSDSDEDKRVNKGKTPSLIQYQNFQK